MTTTVERTDRPPAGGAPGGRTAGGRSRRSMLALTAVESGRLTGRASGRGLASSPTAGSCQ